MNELCQLLLVSPAAGAVRSGPSIPSRVGGGGPAAVLEANSFHMYAEFGGSDRAAQQWNMQEEARAHAEREAAMKAFLEKRIAPPKPEKGGGKGGKGGKKGGGKKGGGKKKGGKKKK